MRHAQENVRHVTGVSQTFRESG